MIHWTRAASRFGAVLLAAGLALPAHSATTAEGAAALAAVFQTYLGKVEGVVRVAPEGEVYRVKLDAGRLITARFPDVDAKGTPVEFLLHENEDGSWTYDQNQGFLLSLRVQEGQVQHTLVAKVRHLAVSGTFDPAMSVFRTLDVEGTGLAVDQGSLETEIVDKKLRFLGSTHSSFEAEAFESSASAVATGPGEIDREYTATWHKQSQTQSTSGPERESVLFVTTRTELVTGKGRVIGERPLAVLDLLAWFAALPPSTTIMDDRAGLKDRLVAGMPFFRKVEATGAWSDISLMSPVGTFGLTSMQGEFAMNGLVADGRLREAFRLEGFTMPAGLVPDWAVPLVPEEMALDLTFADFDAAAAAKMLAGLLDLPAGQEPPETFQDDLLAALMPEGAMDFRLGPGGVKNASYDLTWEGGLRAGPAAPMPTGSAMVTLTGIDAVMAALQSAPPDMGGQVLPVLGMLQAMAKPGAEGQLVWEIEAATPGSLKVNGTEMMGVPQ